MTTPSRLPKRPPIVLFLILLVALGPILFATILINRASAHEFKQNSYGDIISSPPNISKIKNPPKALLGKWSLIYVSPEKCYEECQETLYNLRQLQTALGKDASRVNRLFVPHTNCPHAFCEVFLNEYYPDLTLVKFDPTDLNTLFSITTPDSADSKMLGDIYIMDPRGNVMMHYSAEMDPKGILSDLKRLLRVSKIG